MMKRMFLVCVALLACGCTVDAVHWWEKKKPAVPQQEQRQEVSGSPYLTLRNGAGRNIYFCTGFGENDIKNASSLMVLSRGGSRSFTPRSERIQPRFPTELPVFLFTSVHEPKRRSWAKKSEDLEGNLWILMPKDQSGQMDVEFSYTPGEAGWGEQYLVISKDGSANIINGGKITLHNAQYTE